MASRVGGFEHLTKYVGSRSGTRIVASGDAQFLYEAGLETTRFGLATGRKLGGAVVRNRVRRRLREVLRAMAPSFQPGWDVLIVARPAIVEADHRTLVDALRRLLQRGGVLGGEARPEPWAASAGLRFAV